MRVVGVVMAMVCVLTAQACCHDGRRDKSDAQGALAAALALPRHLARSIFRTIKRNLASGRICFALT